MNRIINSLILLAIVIFSGHQVTAQYLSEETIKLDKALKLIDSYYVDTDRCGDVFWRAYRNGT